MARRTLPLSVPLFVAIATIAAMVLVLSTASFGVAADGDDDQVTATPEKRELRYPNLGSNLDQMVANLQGGRATAQEAAEDAPMHRDESVAVTIHLSERVSEVVEFLEDNGGDPRNVGTDYIEAYVPVSLLGSLSQQPGVLRVREIVPPEPAYGNVTSQAVALHQADPWHNNSLRGQGVKVGIIDAGFTGYSSLRGVELPANVVARCYTDVGVFSSNLADCEPDYEAPR